MRECLEVSSQLSKWAYRGGYLTKLMVGVMVVLVVLVLVVVSSQLSKCAYRGGGVLTDKFRALGLQELDHFGFNGETALEYSSLSIGKTPTYREYLAPFLVPAQEHLDSPARDFPKVLTGGDI